jgi:hypothetical protein
MEQVHGRMHALTACPTACSGLRVLAAYACGVRRHGHSGQLFNWRVPEAPRILSQGESVFRLSQMARHCQCSDFPCPLRKQSSCGKLWDRCVPQLLIWQRL